VDKTFLNKGKIQVDEKNKMGMMMVHWKRLHPWKRSIV
jgi:hypothetical protein